MAVIKDMIGRAEFIRNPSKEENNVLHRNVVYYPSDLAECAKLNGVGKVKEWMVGIIKVYFLDGTAEYANGLRPIGVGGESGPWLVLGCPPGIIKGSVSDPITEVIDENNFDEKFNS